MSEGWVKPWTVQIDAEFWPKHDANIWDAAGFYTFFLNWAVMPVEDGGKKPIRSGDWLVLRQVLVHPVHHRPERQLVVVLT